jgi:peptidoglycan/xylan/chitin deacetylase (PgdA/CDA1 family)
MKPLVALLAVVVVGVIVWLVACQDPSQGNAPAAATPVPAPRVELTAADRQKWAPLPPDRSAIPVVLYHGIGPASDFASPDDERIGVSLEDFAADMSLMRRAGYRTVKLQALVDFIQGKHVTLPSRPLLLTFGDGRIDTWTGADSLLRKLGYSAVLFVDTGTVDRGENREYLSWSQLEKMQNSGRWDLQLHAGEHGHSEIGGKAYYATEKKGESFPEWQQRVRSDVEWGQDELDEHIDGYEPLAFSPPFGDYGQSDPKLGDDFLGWLEGRYDALFTQDENARARPRSDQPLGSLPRERATSRDDLYDMLLTGEQ